MSYKANNLVALTWGREYDGFGRVVRETAPESSASSSTAEQTTVYTYDPSSRLATATSNGSSCFSESYGYNSRGDRTSSSVGVCGAETTKTRSFNSESQLTSSGYVYDALGRNTFIPAADAPSKNAAITLAYNLVDQVTGITQTGSTTSFTYDALGRRVNETAGGLTTVRHYGDSTDNPEWTTQLSGANLTTDVYTGSLGSGLAVTTTFKGTVSNASMQLTNLRGHVVTTLELDSNSVGGWSVYDSFGNPQTSQTNDNLINYSSYGQQERATNTTGLILMGARVYNPETNQFTSKDPIKGGNENSYTYPNDPINGSDFSGMAAYTQRDINNYAVALGVTSSVAALILCNMIPQICIQSVVLFALVVNMSVQYLDILVGPKSMRAQKSFDYKEWGEAGLAAAISTRVNQKIKQQLEKWFGTFFASLIQNVVEGIVTNMIRIASSLTFNFPSNHGKLPKPYAPDRKKVSGRTGKRL